MTGLATRKMLDDPNYGWDATVAGIENAIVELTQAVDSYASHDREDWRSIHALAGRVSVYSRSLDAHLANLARLSYARDER